jgi:hypothetical protein
LLFADLPRKLLFEIVETLRAYPVVVVLSGISLVKCVGIIRKLLPAKFAVSVV